MPLVTRPIAVCFHRFLTCLAVACLLALAGAGAGLADEASHGTLRFGGPRQPQEEPDGAIVSCDDVSHHVFDGLLRKYVDETGMVCYSTWHATESDVNRLGAYLMSLTHVDPTLPAERAAVMAYAINAYNALALWGILHEYPVTSIQRIDGKHSSFAIFDDLQLWWGDDYVSLNGIENDVLRPMKDFRIHFALVCAAKGCPRLRNRAYTAEQLEWQLDDNARDFFADSARFGISRLHKTVHLSPIMKWYRDDFGETDCDLVTTVFRYLPPDDRAWLSEHSDWTMTYLGYDWALNDQCPTIGVAFAAHPYKVWSKLSPTVESLKTMRLPLRRTSSGDQCAANVRPAPSLEASATQDGSTDLEPSPSITRESVGPELLLTPAPVIAE